MRLVPGPPCAACYTGQVMIESNAATMALNLEHDPKHAGILRDSFAFAFLLGVTSALRAHEKVCHDFALCRYHREHMATMTARSGQKLPAWVLEAGEIVPDGE